ncbi:MAG TPA: hypothetical protein VFT43_08290, partial [Candidatus Polarisedimenticolia bacterium]|nr:hypothetical protein [Candidatus Polarisedimenticolia bacterium]
LRKGKLLMVDPEGEESGLAPAAPGLFRVGDEQPTAERLRFDSIVRGKAQRASYSGCDYFRTFTP